MSTKSLELLSWTVCVLWRFGKLYIELDIFGTETPRHHLKSIQKSHRQQYSQVRSSGFEVSFALLPTKRNSFLFYRYKCLLHSFYIPVGYPWIILG